MRLGKQLFVVAGVGVAVQMVLTAGCSKPLKSEGEAGETKGARPSTGPSDKRSCGLTPECLPAHPFMLFSQSDILAIAARKNRDFARADAIRNELAAKGIELLDSKDGTTWKVK